MSGNGENRVSLDSRLHGSNNTQEIYKGFEYAGGGVRAGIDDGTKVANIDFTQDYSNRHGNPLGYNTDISLFIT